MKDERLAEINRRNAQASTGPITEEGKRAARVNALKLGLSGRGLILPEHEAGLAMERKERLRAGLAIEGDHLWAEILLEQVAVESVRLERCQQEERLVRERMAAEAAVLWVEDRTLEAVRLGSTIGRDPETVRLTLERSLHGIEWLLGRWGLLRQAIELRGEWTEAQATLAANLLGHAEADRVDGIAPSREDLLALADREIGRIEALRPSRVGMDERDRNLAEVGISPDVERRLKTLRRYESASRRAMEKGMDELRRYRGESTPVTAPRSVAEAVVEPKSPEYETKPIASETPPAPAAWRVSSPPANPPFPAPHLPHGMPRLNLGGEQPRNRRQRRAVESILRRG